MPIKIPKLQKRRSSGNALEEILNPPEPSFKVIERPSSRSKSFDGGITLKMASRPRPAPPPKDIREVQDDNIFAPQETINRGSNGTENSLTASHYDSGASSARLSSSSTNPSSIESRPEKVMHNNNQRPFNDIPVPPTPSARTVFLKNTARTFSFGIGSKASKESFHNSTPPPLPPLPQPQRPEGVGELRDRQVTASSSSTATPPRLFDSDLALEHSELDGFGKMFDNFKMHSSREVSPMRPNFQEDVTSSPPATYPPTSYRDYDSSQISATNTATPFLAGKADNLQSSPYSFVSQDSHEVMIRSPSPPKSAVRTFASRFAPQSIKNTDASRMKDSGNRPGTMDTPTNTVFKARSRSPEKPTQSRFNGTSPLSDVGSFVQDPSLAAHAELAARYQDIKPSMPKPPPTNKVMTPAQFEKYRQQKEMDHRLGIKDESDESEPEENYEEEDEIERDRKAAKQRQKQEASLAVYRQTMMKVTGEQNPSRPGSGLSDRGRQSPGDMSRRVSRMTLDPRQTENQQEEEEEDEDVPLGILAAHGFPNKNRPPTRLTGTRSFSPAPAAGQSQSAPSVANEPNSRGSLPVFARNLPQDPYYGAGLVNPSNRESLAFHSNAGQYMAHSGASTAHPLHPAGLVGVIDGEEKARAWRRGSPNTQGGYDLPPGVQHPGMMRSQTTPNMPYGYPGMAPPLTPGDQAQIQMSQSMSQMMQMQMQWMAQMQQFFTTAQGGPAAPGMPPNNNFLAPPGGMPRPQSAYQIPPTATGPRTMSMMNSQPPSWNNAPTMYPGTDSAVGGYAPSIAPSERSNVGLASRYRPVSIAPAGESDAHSNRRASTFTSSTVRPFSQMNPGSQGMVSDSQLASATRKPLPIRKVDDDEEDEEQGWAEMKAKKELKQRRWKLRKGQKALENLYSN